MIRDLVMCEFGADHGANENLGRILSNNLHVAHSFDICTRRQEKSQWTYNRVIGKVAGLSKAIALTFDMPTREPRRISRDGWKITASLKKLTLASCHPYDRRAK